MRNLKLFLIIFALFIFANCRNKHSGESIENNIGKTKKIAFVYYAPEPAVESLMRGIIDGLKNYGLEENKNIQIIYKHTNADMTNISMIFQQLDSSGLDLIVPLSTPCFAAAVKSVKKTPIVFSYASDPLAVGIGNNFNEHLPNLTGIGSFDPVKESIDLICELLPHTKIIGTIYNSSEINSLKVIEAAREYCLARGIKLEEVTISSTSEIYQAAQSLILNKIDAFYGSSDNTLTQCLAAVINIMDKNKIPIISNVAEYIDSGALATVGFGWYKVGVKTSEKISKVLSGTKPSVIPIENFIDSDISINREIAQKFNINTDRN